MSCLGSHAGNLPITAKRWHGNEWPLAFFFFFSEGKWPDFCWHRNGEWLIRIIFVAVTSTRSSIFWSSLIFNCTSWRTIVTLLISKTWGQPIFHQVVAMQKRLYQIKNSSIDCERMYSRYCSKRMRRSRSEAVGINCNKAFIHSWMSVASSLLTLSR